MFTTTVRTLIDGPRNLVMLFTGVSDGTGAETNCRKVDVSELTPPCRNVKILEYEYEVSGGILQLLWDDDSPTGPVAFDNLASVGERCYEETAGLTNGGSVNASGDILFSTIGFDVGSSYSIKLTMVKKF